MVNTVTVTPSKANSCPKFAVEGDGYSLWLAKGVLARLTAVGGPGESYSDAILRLAKEEAA